MCLSDTMLVGGWSLTVFETPDVLLPILYSADLFEHKDRSLVNKQTGEKFVYDFLEANTSEVEKKFELRSSRAHPLDAQIEAEILKHQGIACLAGLSSLANIRDVLLLGSAILQSGGIAIRIETSGNFCNGDDWC